MLIRSSFALGCAGLALVAGSASAVADQMAFTATAGVTMVADGGADINYNDSLETILWVAPGKSGLLQFDVSGLPAGVSIDSATLTLQNGFVGNGTPVIEVYQETEAWTEPTVTWNSPTGDASGNPWDAAVGGFGPGMAVGTNVLDTTIVNSLSLFDWDVTSAVQAWYSDPSSNHGLLLRRGGFSDGVKLLTTEGAVANEGTPPTLHVVYTVPEPASGALIGLASLAALRHRPVRGR